MEYDIEIDVTSTKELIDSDEQVLLIDCRKPHEIAICRLEGAMEIPMRKTKKRLAELEPFKDQRIVVYGHLGGRSLQVAKLLRKHGFTTAQNMTGGIDKWSLEVDPSVARY